MSSATTPNASVGKSPSRRKRDSNENPEQRKKRKALSRALVIRRVNESLPSAETSEIIVDLPAEIPTISSHAAHQPSPERNSVVGIDEVLMIEDGEIVGSAGKPDKGKRPARTPAKPCPRCQEPHWKRDFPENPTKIDKGKSKASESKGPRNQGKRKEMKAVDRKTKRGNDSSSLFPDGTFVLVRIPDGIQDTLSEVVFASLCVIARISRAGMVIGSMSKKFWFIGYEKIEEASSVVGKKVIFLKGHESDTEMTSEVIPYLTGGPKVFYTNKVGPMRDLALQKLLEQKFPEEKYWFGRHMRGTATLQGRLVCFENGLTFYSFDLGESESFVVRFKAVNREKKCLNCGEEHAEGTIGCSRIYPSVTSEDLKMRLLKRP